MGFLIVEPKEIQRDSIDILPKDHESLILETQDKDCLRKTVQTGEPILDGSAQSNFEQAYKGGRDHDVVSWGRCCVDLFGGCLIEKRRKEFECFWMNIIATTRGTGRTLRHCGYGMSKNGHRNGNT